MNSQTMMLAVIGDPIAHSKSPLMMNRAFRELGINYAYSAFRVSAEQLPRAIAGVRALGMRGLNVTIPHKEAVIAFMDELDESARLIGAVNTVVNEQGRLIGYNTDGIGYVRSLHEETGFEVTDKTIAIIGAGGAARAVIYALAKNGAKRIMIANRTLSRAQQLVDHFASLVDIVAIETSDLHKSAPDVDLLLNTTSVGMSPQVEACPIEDASWIHERMVVSDLIYNPRETKLLQLARAQGAKTHGGLGMLVNQGAYAFEYWTGHPAPIAVMWEEVERK
jgi:shikimate dehydrogenase